MATVERARMGRPRGTGNITPKQMRELRRVYQQGNLTVQETADLFGITHGAVRFHTRDLPPRRAGNRTSTTRQQEEEIADALRVPGAVMRRIAHNCGVSEGVVKRVRDQYRITIMPEQEPEPVRKPLQLRLANGQRVPNEPLRDVVAASSLTLGAISKQMGFEARDISRLKRALGLVPVYTYLDGKRFEHAQNTIGVEYAQAIARTIGVDFDVLYPDRPAQERAAVCGCGEPKLWDAEQCGFCAEQAEGRLTDFEQLLRMEYAA